jgi:hypothetical protein
LHILVSSARARKRSSGEVIFRIWSVVYGGGPGGAIFAVVLNTIPRVSRLEVNISSVWFAQAQTVMTEQRRRKREQQVWGKLVQNHANHAT